MKRESAPSYKRVMRELYGDFMHPDFDRAGGITRAEHVENVSRSHRFKPYCKGPDGKFVRKRLWKESQTAAEREK